MAGEHGKQKKTKRKRKQERRQIHPRNKYAEVAPDFCYLASLYPSFAPFVTFTEKAHLARIDWTDYNATRELTRTLLFHDFGIQWWIPDGQLCPTVTNRANYIHWINDLLTMHPSPWHDTSGGTWGLDIGTGANCVYPLLGASIYGWNFIGTDITNTALEWAKWNVQQNPHLATLISIRDVKELMHKSDMKLDEGIETGPMPLCTDSFGVGMRDSELLKAKVSPTMNGSSKEIREHDERNIDIISRTRKLLESKGLQVVDAPSEDVEEHDEAKIDTGSDKVIERNNEGKVDINRKTGEPLEFKWLLVVNTPSEDFEGCDEGKNDNGPNKEVEENDEEKVDINAKSIKPVEFKASEVANVPNIGLKEYNQGKICVDSKSSETQMVVEDPMVVILGGNSEDLQYSDLPVLAGVVGEDERFDFCMCNPPFFESIKDAGANPRTACGGTAAEMVYPGGEAAFITKMIQDSIMLKNQIHWFTTMVGRKVNVKLLSSELRKNGVQILRTTEFVQGRTSRWGLAWTFNALKGCMLSERAISANKNRHYFMLEGIPRNCRTLSVLEGMVNSMSGFQVTCDIDSAQLSLKGFFQEETDIERLPENMNGPHFILSIFEQAPGTLSIKGILQKEHIKYSGRFSTLFNSIAQNMKELYCKGLESKQ